MTARPELLEFKFERDPNYRFVPVNGIWGGPTLRGDIRVEFFYEHQTTPGTVTNRVNEDGSLGEEAKRDAATFTRTLMVGMMLTADQAESIGQWLQERAKQVKAAIESRARSAGT